MAAFGYIWILGLPFAQPVVALPAKALAEASTTKVVIRNGLVYDLNAAAFAAGVLLGSPLRQARQVCPDLTNAPFVEAAYEDRLRSLIGVLRGHTHRFEFDGPNRLFIDFSGSGQPSKVLADLAAACAGFAVVAGIGSSKLSARAAVLAALARRSAVRHPMFLPLPEPSLPELGDAGTPACLSSGRVGRQAVLQVLDLLTGGIEGERAFLGRLPVGYLWPVAEEKRERLYRLGLKTWGEVARCDERELAHVLGPEGRRIIGLAQGTDCQAVNPSYTPDEIIRRVDFDAPVASKLALKRSLTLLGLDLGHALAEEGLSGRELELVLYQDDGEITHLSRSFGRPRGGPEAIAGAFVALLEQSFPAGAVTGMEVTARDLQAALRQQLSFLDRAVGDTRQGTLLETLASLDRKFPGGAVRLGAPPVSRRELMLRLIDPLRRQQEGKLIREPAD